MQESVEIRRLNISDAESLSRQANNKKIWDNLRDYIPYPYTVENAKEFIARTENENPALTFGILFEKDLCGVIGLVEKTDVNRLCSELGYWIGESFWGKGIATKAVNLVTDYGFKVLSLERIYSSVFDFNQASMRVLEKNGFKKEGVLRNSVIKNGKIHDEHLYARLRNE